MTFARLACAALAFAALACQPIPPVPVSPVNAPLGATPALAGNWRLTMRDTIQGRDANGDMELRATTQPDTASRFPAAETRSLVLLEPYEGSARIDLTLVGAVTSFSPSSADPTLPGVVVQVELTRGANDAVTRRAELALGRVIRGGRNQQTPAYTAMFIGRWSTDTLAGTWESAECACAPRAAGYFRAVRIR